MHIAIFDAVVSTPLRALHSLDAILDKAAADIAAGKLDADAVLHARLAPDMFDLTRQLQLVTDFAKSPAARLAGVGTADRARIHPEAYRLKAPLAPLHAAMADGVTIDPARLEPPATAQPLIIEGSGGLMVPLTLDFMMIDLFARWQLPVILVTSTELGTINHTLLSLEALRARAVPIHGVVFVGEERPATQDTICRSGQVRQLGRLPRLDPLDAATLQAAMASAFNVIDFTNIIAGGASHG